MTEQIRIAIAGAGRMGQAIARLAENDPATVLLGIWARGDDLDALVADADVVIDFSLPEATSTVVDAALRHARPLVCGVSGLDTDQARALDDAARRLAVVYDRNMSQGIAVLGGVVGSVAAMLGEGFAVRIEETHHVHKKDAPSGTALQLGERVAEARGVNPAAIEYASERLGEVPGEHSVIFTSPTETITLSHSVTTRDVFAEGALKAAKWVIGRPPGLYAMRDVLSNA